MFFKITLNIWKKNLIAFLIRLFGLTISLTFLILLLSYLLNEYSYDSQIINKQNKYRLIVEDLPNSTKNALIPFPIATLILEKIPEIKSVFRYSYLRDVRIRKNSELIYERNFYCTDSEIFEGFNISLLSGSCANFNTDYNVAISKKIAEKYFGHNNPIGNTFSIEQGSKEIHVNVVAVYNNIPVLSTFNADIIGSFKIAKYFQDTPSNPFSKRNISTYVTLNGNSNQNTIEQNINNTIAADLNSSENYFHLQKFEDLYFGSQEITNSFLPSGSRLNIKLFFIISVIVFLIATSNFTIISTSAHFHRKQEYFIRLINGASKFDIFFLICWEILLILFISGILSIISVQYLLPYASFIFQKQDLLISNILSRLFLTVIAIIILIGVITTFVTSIYIFQKNDGEVLQFSTNKSPAFFKLNRFLVFIQIMIFSALIVISTLLIHQWDFLKSSSNLGFNMNNTLVLTISKDLTNKEEVVVNTLVNNPNIQNICMASNIPLYGPYQQTTVYKKEDLTKNYNIDMLMIGENYFNTLDINIKEGREFSFNNSYDFDNSIMLNEAAVKFFEISDPIGKKVMWRKVIGVVSDFKMQSLYNKVGPIIIYPWKDANYILINYSGDKLKVVEYIKSKLTEIAPLSSNSIFDYLNIIDTIYEHEKRMRLIFTVFAIVTIFIGILGILGLLIFSIQKRKKEIAIRMIHGASFVNIITIFSKELVIVLLISNAITYPLIWYFVNDWLNNFEYHIVINIFYFMFATIITFFLIIITVIFTTQSHIKQNPIFMINDE